MRIQCVQHVFFENPGAIVYWAQERGHECSVSRLYAGEELPPMDSWDWMFVLGGPMSVHDEREYPWLLGEKRYIAEAVRSNKTVIGICLGAQLIADALGAKVYPNEQKEIGWFPLQWTKAGLNMPVFQSFPEAPIVFHWHGETFDLPEGATLLASSAACRNQAFAFGRSVYGFQFHLEMMQDNVRLIVENCGDEIGDAMFVQTAEEMLDAGPQMKQSVALLESFLNRLEQAGQSSD